ncbi:MAG: hypothetical protein IH948_01565 [Bacteroidetes bacterium]|nr:hypothetical protein [Bacteroidota bacterium]
MPLKINNIEDSNFSRPTKDQVDNGIEELKRLAQKNPPNFKLIRDTY